MSRRKSRVKLRYVRSVEDLLRQLELRDSSVLLPAQSDKISVSCQIIKL